MYSYAKKAEIRVKTCIHTLHATRTPHAVKVAYYAPSWHLWTWAGNRCLDVGADTGGLKLAALSYTQPAHSALVRLAVGAACTGLYGSMDGMSAGTDLR